MNIVWNNRKDRSLFQIKNNVKHPSCIIYKYNCLSGENHDGEFVRNVIERWVDNEDTNKKSEPAKHLKYFPDHQFE